MFKERKVRHALLILTLLLLPSCLFAAPGPIDPFPEPPPPVYNLAGTGISSTSIQLTWSHSGLNVDLFRIVRSYSPDFDSPSYFSVSSATRTWTDTNVDHDGCDVWYKVIARNEDGNSAAKAVVVPIPPATFSVVFGTDAHGDYHGSRISWSYWSTYADEFFVDNTITTYDATKTAGAIGDYYSSSDFTAYASAGYVFPYELYATNSRLDGVGKSRTLTVNYVRPGIDLQQPTTGTVLKTGEAVTIDFDMIGYYPDNNGSVNDPVFLIEFGDWLETTVKVGWYHASAFPVQVTIPNLGTTTTECRVLVNYVDGPDIWLRYYSPEFTYQYQYVPPPPNTSFTTTLPTSGQNFVYGTHAKVAWAVTNPGEVSEVHPAIYSGGDVISSTEGVGLYDSPQYLLLDRVVRGTGTTTGYFSLRDQEWNEIAYSPGFNMVEPYMNNFSVRDGGGGWVIDTLSIYNPYTYLHWNTNVPSVPSGVPASYYYTFSVDAEVYLNGNFVTTTNTSVYSADVNGNDPGDAVYYSYSLNKFYTCVVPNLVWLTSDHEIRYRIVMSSKNSSYVYYTSLMPISTSLFKTASEQLSENKSETDFAGKEVSITPNPLNPTGLIQFNLSNSAFVELQVFDILGRSVANLQSGPLNRGHHTYRFDGTQLSSGVYLVRLQRGDDISTHRLVLVK